MWLIAEFHPYHLMVVMVVLTVLVIVRVFAIKEHTADATAIMGCEMIIR